MSDLLGPTGAPVPDPNADPVKDLLEDDLAKMTGHIVETMTTLGLACVVVVHGALEGKLRRIYNTNLTSKADRIALLETLLKIEQSDGIHMPATHPLT